MKTFSMPPGNEEARIVSCPICGADEFRLVWRCDGFEFQKCSGCSVLYQNPQPDQRMLLDRYDSEYFQYEREHEETFHRLMRLSLMDVNFEGLTSRFPHGQKSFLDVGCATGMLIASMGSEGWRTRGVEVCEPAARFGIEHRGVEISIGTLAEALLRTSSFEVIHSSHLIEHLTEPLPFLSECRRVLRENGLLITTTPNFNGFQARLFGSRWRSAIADHMVLYSKRTLTLALATAGFKPLIFKTWGGLATGTAPGPVKAIADRGAKLFGFGDVMICVAKPS